MTVSLSGLSCLVILLLTIYNLYFIFPSHFVYDYTRLLNFAPVPNCFPPKKRTMKCCFFVGVQVKRLSRTESFVEASILCAINWSVSQHIKCSVHLLNGCFRRLT